MGFLDWVSTGVQRVLADRAVRQGPDPAATCKWLPVIDRDYCTGCNACVEACEHGCLGQVWDFATLLKPLQCGSEGRCAEACPENLIRMEWVPAAGETTTGRWRLAAGSSPGAA